MQFPANRLVPKGGDIYAHIFENSRTGLARGLFWSITIEFEPVDYGEEQFDCSTTCEWMNWPIRDWHDLDGKRLNALYGDDGIEASFYLTRHDSAKHVRLSIQRTSAADFQVSMAMTVNFSGYYGDDENPDLLVSGDVVIPFTGLLVVPDNLFPKPTTVEEVNGVAREFVDLNCYEAPELDRHRYVFQPRI
jgi:hypothetical protein